MSDDAAMERVTNQSVREMAGTKGFSSVGEQLGKSAANAGCFFPAIAENDWGTTNQAAAVIDVARLGTAFDATDYLAPPIEQ